MSGFLSLLTTIMNNRQDERARAEGQPYRDAMTKSLNLANQRNELANKGITSISDAYRAGRGESGDDISGVQAALSKASEIGLPDEGEKYARVIDLNEKLDEMKARNQTWGGSNQYYQVKNQLDTASQTGKYLNELHRTGGMGLVKQVVDQNPQLQKIVGDPEKLIFNQEGVMHPALHAQTKEPIPNWFYMVDNEGKTKMVELKPQQAAKDFDQINLGNRVRIVPRDGSAPYDIPVGARPSTAKAGGGGSGGSSSGRSGVSAGGQGKAPSGYRWNSDGSLEPIPGGPAAMKAAANRQSMGSGQDAIDASIATIDKLLTHPGRKAATGLSSLNPINFVPGTEGYDFGKELESFDAKLFLSNISAMKGMGALSNAEGLKVSAAAGAIKPGMSEKAFKQNLETIRSNLEKARIRAESGNLLTQGSSAPKQSQIVTPKQQKSETVNNLRSKYGIGK